MTAACDSFSISGSERFWLAEKLNTFLTDSIMLNLLSGIVVVLYTSSARDRYEAPSPPGMLAYKPQNTNIS